MLLSASLIAVGVGGSLLTTSSNLLSAGSGYSPSLFLAVLIVSAVGGAVVYGAK